MFSMHFSYGAVKHCFHLSRAAMSNPRPRWRFMRPSL